MTITLSAAPPDGRDGDDNDLLAGLLAELKLTTAAAELPEVLEQATEQETSYTQFLHHLLQRELSARMQRRVTRRLKRSRIKESPGLDEFDFSLRPRLKPAAVKQLLDCQYLRDGRPIMCIGRAGTGKTHVAKALGHAACMKGYSVYFVNTADLLEELHAALADNSFGRVFKRYANVDLLILDEVGYLPLGEQKADYLFRLVSARHPRRSTIVTTNTGFTRWGRFFPNQGQAIATVDRLLDRSTVMRFTGKSFRQPEEVIGGEDEGDEE